MRPVLGRYRLVQVIATGGMGTVYLARAVGRGGFSRPVALKVLHRHLATEPRFVAMFFEEARLAARMAHPHVVDVFDVDEIDGEYVLAMRYVEGGSVAGLLRALHARGTKLPEGVALSIVRDMLAGLHAAHEAKGETGEPLGIVHRDVSPQNVLLDLQGAAQLTDFGVARARGGLVSTQGHSLKGKLRYLAPEQLDTGTIDRRADIFASGIVLWELLTGHALFTGESDVSVIHQVLRHSIEPPGASSLAIDEVCLRALERDPSRRFETAAEFSDALAAAAKRGMGSRDDVARLASDAFLDDVTARREALARSAAAPESREPGEPREPQPEARSPRIPRLALLAAAAAAVAGAVTLIAWPRRAPVSESVPISAPSDAATPIAPPPPPAPTPPAPASAASAPPKKSPPRPRSHPAKSTATTSAPVPSAHLEPYIPPSP